MQNVQHYKSNFRVLVVNGNFSKTGVLIPIMLTKLIGKLAMFSTNLIYNSNLILIYINVSKLRSDLFPELGRL